MKIITKIKEKVKSLTLKKIFFFYLKWIPRIAISMLTGFLIVYFYATLPLALDRVELKKGDRTVIIQQTVHVADKEFYQDLNTYIRILKANDFKHYFEKVKYSNQKDFKDFEQKTGITSNLGMYFLNSGLSSESVELNRENAENIDVEITEITKRITKKIITDKDKKELIKLSEDKTFEKYNRDFIGRTVLKAGVKFQLLLEELNLNFLLNGEFRSVILDMRNDNVIENILSNKNDIIVTYGAMHKAGLVKSLEENGFKIIKTEKVLAIK